jgi:hypothetical protein
MVASGAQSAEIEDATYFGASAADAALPCEGAALAVARGEAGEAGDGAAASGAQFGKEGEKGRGPYRADAWSLLEALRLGGKRGLGVEMCGDEFIEFEAALFELRDALSDVAPQDFVGRGFQVLVFLGDEGDDLAAALDQGAEVFLAGAGVGRGGRLEQGTELGEHASIKAVVFGEVAEALSELSGTSGMKDGDGEVALAQEAHDRAFVAAGGFADHLNGTAVAGDALKEGAVAGGVVREIETGACQVAGEGEFGHVQTEVDAGSGLMHDEV